MCRIGRVSPAGGVLSLQGKDYCNVTGRFRFSVCDISGQGPDLVDTDAILSEVCQHCQHVVGMRVL